MRRVSQIRAITNAEFIQMMEKCRPPTGWPSTIGQYLCPTLVQINSLFQTTNSYRKLCWARLDMSPLSPPTHDRLEASKKAYEQGARWALRPPRVNPILARGPRPAKRRREDGVRFKRGSDKVQGRPLRAPHPLG